MKFNRVVLAAVATAGLIGSVYADPSPFCIAVNGGFDNGGTTFVARQFELPGPNKCTPWAGYTKVPGTVVVTTSGTACVSDDGNVLTVGVSGFNPNSTTGPDYIQLCLEGSMCTDADVGVFNNPLAGNGYDSGSVGGPGFGSPAAQIDCTWDVLDLSSNHA